MLSKLFVTNVAVTKPIPEDDYIASLPAVRNLRAMGELDFHKPVTFFVGENGVGKSTLIEAIAVHAGFNAEGGSRNFNFSTHAASSTAMTMSCSTARRRSSCTTKPSYGSISASCNAEQKQNANLRRNKNVRREKAHDPAPGELPLLP